MLLLGVDPRSGTDPGSGEVGNSGPLGWTLVFVRLWNTFKICPHSRTKLVAKLSSAEAGDKVPTPEVKEDFLCAHVQEGFLDVKEPLFSPANKSVNMYTL